MLDTMLRISDSNAMRLERLVRRVYGCERFGVGHMADTDHFGMYPYHAALLIIAPKYYKAQGGRSEEYWKPIQAFIDKYEEAFQQSNTEKYDDKIVDAYVSDLEKIVRRYYRCLAPKKK